MQVETILSLLRHGDCRETVFVGQRYQSPTHRVDGVENEHLRGANASDQPRRLVHVRCGSEAQRPGMGATPGCRVFRRRGCRGCVGRRQDIALRVQQPQAPGCWNVS